MRDFLNKIKKLGILAVLLVAVTSSQAATTSLLPVPKARFFDAGGTPLVGGKVYTYYAGTTTPKASYTDSTGTSANTNPVILDSTGQANIWLASGAYKIVLKDSTDVTQWTVDNVISSGATIGNYAVASGTNTYTATIAPVPVSYAAGQSYLINFTNSNSGASTINLNGLGAKNLYHQDGTVLNSGDIAANSIQLIAYDGTEFQILGSSGGGGGGGITALTGDVTASGSGSVPATLATVNSNIGSFGTATQSPTITVNGKGLVTAAVNTTITPAESNITFTDITTGNSSTSKHGFVPKLPNDASKFYNGVGAFVPAGSYVLISSQTVSAVSAIPFTGLDSTYAKYIIDIQDLRQSGSSNLALRCSTNNGVSYRTVSGDYAYASQGIKASTNAVVKVGNSSTDSGVLEADGAQQGGHFGTIELFNLSSSAQSKGAIVQMSIASAIPNPTDLWSSNGSVLFKNNITGGILTTAVNAVEIISDGGDTLTGTVKLYGVLP